MTDFEDRLWTDLVNDHGTELTTMRARPRGKRRRSWTAPLAAGGATLTAAAVAGALTFTASTSPPAYAVVVNANGSVTLTINELIGIERANAQLARLGVRARVAELALPCAERGHFIRARLSPRAPLPVEPELLRRGKGPYGRLRMIIHPGAIPHGDTLLLSVRALDVSRSPAATHRFGDIRGIATSMGLYRGAAPACTGGLVTLRGADAR
jgi:hypothetical protein